MTKLAPLAAVVAVALLAAGAWAHEVGLSRGEYRLSGEVVETELVFSRRELATLVAELDEDRDGAVAADEVTRARPALEARVVREVSVRADGARCEGSLTDARLVEEDGLAVRGAYRCRARPAKLSIELPVLADLAHGHRHVAHVEAGGASVDQVLHRRSPSLDLAIGDAADAVPAEPRSSASVAWSFFVSGIEHIVLGIDHLAFLFGLILLGGRWRSILAMVTAFTVAHSITLGLAVMGVWTPSPAWIEPAIALSVAYVGIENWFVKDPAKRWRITFPFGLVHGFGFAGALGEIALPRPQIPVALLTFNLGVEAGQVALLAIALPLVLLARRHEWFKTTGVKALSAAVALAGVVWFVTRVAGV